MMIDSTMTKNKPNTPEQKHWSKVEYLHETVTNPNIHIQGTHSYYSPAWTGSFEESVVRYHYGDEYSRSTWTPRWPIDLLYIGDYVCIGPETVIVMGGNNTHRGDWFSCYPHLEYIDDLYVGKGNTTIESGAWLGMRSMIMPGVRIGEGAIVAAGAVVLQNVPPYAIVGGNPAKLVRLRFPEPIVTRLLALGIYSWDDNKAESLRRFICGNDIDALEAAAARYDAR